MSTQESERPWRDPDLLEELYWEERMSQGEIAEELGCAPRTVLEWMKEYDIDTRTGYWRKPFEERFWDRVDIGDADECWEWTGTRGYGDYGQVKKDGTFYTSHKIALELEEGSIGDLWALHHCDNPPCCNPNHLYAGTPSQNQYDAWERGDRDFTGEGNPNAKLTEQDVLDIRSREDEATAEELADEYGITVSHMKKILDRGAWEGVEPEGSNKTNLGEDDGS